MGSVWEICFHLSNCFYELRCETDLVSFFCLFLIRKLEQHSSHPYTVHVFALSFTKSWYPAVSIETNRSSFICILCTRFSHHRIKVCSSVYNKQIGEINCMELLFSSFITIPGIWASNKPQKISSSPAISCNVFKVELWWFQQLQVPVYCYTQQLVKWSRVYILHLPEVSKKFAELSL